MRIKQIAEVEIILEGPIRSDEMIKKIILREIGDMFYSVVIKKIEKKIVEDK